MCTRKFREMRRHASCYFLLLPTFALLTVFSLAPFLWAFAVSLFRYEVGADAQFVGLANYVEFLAVDPITWPSFGHMLFLTTFGACVFIVVPLIIAKLIFSLNSETWRYVYRVVFLLPIVVPGIAIQLIWGSLVYGDYGLVNSALRLAGLGHLATGWLSDPRLVLPSLAFIGFPFAHSINILIFYAGLASIPESVHEAAAVDGVSGVRKFLSVDVPLVLSQIKLILILTIITGVQSFEGILILTRGGPGFESTVPGLWMYFNAFSFQRMGYACAIGVVLFLIIFALTLLNMRYFVSSERIQRVS